MQLMADAGYASGFDISMYVTNNQARVDLTTMLQGYWAALGVNVTPVIGEWGSFSDAVCGGKADAYAMSWSWYPDPYFFLNNLFASNQTTAIGNGAGYVNAEVDDLLLKAVQTTDQDERAKYYQQVIEIVMNDCVGVYYAVPNVFYAQISPSEPTPCFASSRPAATLGLSKDAYLIGSAAEARVLPAYLRFSRIWVIP